jgi:hypothetical protein
LPPVVTALAWSPDSTRLAALAEEGPWGSVGRLGLYVTVPGREPEVWNTDDRCLIAGDGDELVWRDDRTIVVLESAHANRTETSVRIGQRRVDEAVIARFAKNTEVWETTPGTLTSPMNYLVRWWYSRHPGA